MSKIARAPAEFLLYSAVRWAVAAVGRLPRRLSYRFCGALGSWFHAVDARHRRIGLINLEIAFPDQPESWRRSVLQQSFRRLGEHFVELSRLPLSSAEDIRRQVDYQAGFGLEHYEAARSLGSAVIFVTAHVSAWELLPVGHAVLGHPLSFVVRPLDNRWLDRWSVSVRQRFGNLVIPKRGSLRTILKNLREGVDVGLLIDQNVQEKDGVYVPFFGRPACTTASVAMIAMKTNVPVVPGFIVPGNVLGQYKIRFFPPLQVRHVGSPADNVRENTRIYLSYVERVVREYPDCWLWGHRRFRTQPDGSDPYL